MSNVQHIYLLCETTIWHLPVYMLSFFNLIFTLFIFISPKTGVALLLMSRSRAVAVGCGKTVCYFVVVKIKKKFFKKASALMEINYLHLKDKNSFKFLNNFYTLIHIYILKYLIMCKTERPRIHKMALYQVCVWELLKILIGMWIWKPFILTERRQGERGKM